MNKKSDTTQPLVPKMRLAFSGKLTLRDIGACGINDISVVVTDNNRRKHLLTISKRQGQQEHDHAPSERMQEECKSSTETQEYYTFSLSAAESLVPRVVPCDAKKGEKYTDPSDGCIWLVKSATLGSGDLMELSILCKGTDPDDRVPECPHIGTRLNYTCPTEEAWEGEK